MRQSDIDRLPELPTADEFAEVIGLDGEQVRILCAAGSLPGVQVEGEWRVRKAAALRRIRSVAGIDLSPLG